VSVAAAVALAKVRGVSYVGQKFLIDRFGSALKVTEASGARSENDPTTRQLLSIVAKEADLKQAENVVRRTEMLGAWICAYGSTEYPKLLAEISDPPLVLFGKGEWPKTDLPWLAVVGPRNPSRYGARIAQLLASDLAREGIVIVSGLARGVDAIAHESALKEKRPTVAVIGCGIDQVYPPEHAHLQERIAKSGTVVTEFFPGESPLKDHFPRRNRILSGLSRGVLVIEAGETSGALITVRHALDQSRDVFAVPGQIDSPLSIGSNRIISEGAKLVATSDDVLEEWGLAPGKLYRTNSSPEAQKEETDGLSEDAKAVLHALGLGMGASVDELARKEQRPVENMLRTLMELEIRGLVIRASDARYSRAAG